MLELVRDKHCFSFVVAQVVHLHLGYIRAVVEQSAVTVGCPLATAFDGCELTIKLIEVVITDQNPKDIKLLIDIVL